jgi:hypothetical protein
MPGEPTPQERVRHFMATVEDYENLQATFPLLPSINILGHKDDDAARWTVVIHAMLLRKYFQKDDKLKLSRVVAAVRQCVVKDDLPKADWDELERSVNTVRDMGVHVSGDGPGYGESELLQAHLYGRYLHGDLDKWRITEAVGATGSDSALHMATFKRARRVLDIADLIRAGVEQGAVNYFK